MMLQHLGAIDLHIEIEIIHQTCLLFPWNMSKKGQYTWIVTAQYIYFDIFITSCAQNEGIKIHT
jgi:hypothetical protein